MQLAGKGDKVTELQGLIRFWKATLQSAWFLLEPSVKLHIENTIKHLELLQAKERGTKCH